MKNWKDWLYFVAFMAATIALSATFRVEIADAFIGSWEADDCSRLDRQNRHGYPVNVPDYCAPHGFEPRQAAPIGGDR